MLAHTRSPSITAKHDTGCGAVHPSCHATGPGFRRPRQEHCVRGPPSMHYTSACTAGTDRSLYTHLRSGHCMLQLACLPPGGQTCTTITSKALLVCTLAGILLHNAVKPGHDERKQHRVTCSSSAHSSSCSRRSARAPSKPAAACSSRSSRLAQRAAPNAAAAACRRSTRWSSHRRPTDRQRSAGCGRNAMPSASLTGGGGGARLGAGWSKSEADQAACRGAQAGMLCLHAGRRSRACRTRQPRLHPSAQAPERARGAPPERARRRRPRRGTAPRRRRATGAGAWQRPAGPRPAAAAARAAPGAGRTLRRGRAQRRRPAARQGRRPAGSRARRRAAAPRGARRPAGTRTAPAHRHGVGAGNPQNTLVFCWSERGL